eukprot:2317174-Pyramimonas_sp.AAC.1
MILQTVYALVRALLHSFLSFYASNPLRATHVYPYGGPSRLFCCFPPHDGLFLQVCILRGISSDEAASEAGVEEAVLVAWLEEQKTGTSGSSRDVSTHIARWLRSQTSTRSTQPQPRPLAATDAAPDAPPESTPGEIQLTAPAPECDEAAVEATEPPSAAPAVDAPAPSVPSGDEAQGAQGEGDKPPVPMDATAASGEMEAAAAVREQERASAHKSASTSGTGVTPRVGGGAR